MTDVTTTSSTTTTSPATPVVLGPGEVVGPALPEPGWRTSEMWLTFIPVGLGVLLTSGLIADGSIWARLIGAAISMFSAFGYGMHRSKVKTAAIASGVTVLSTSTAPRFSSSRSLVTLVAVVLGVGALQPACGAPVVAAGGAVVIDCLVKDRTELANLVGSLWSVFTSGGSWKDVENAAIAAGKELGGCALAEVVQHYLSPPAGRAAPRGELGRQARFALEDYRSRYVNGATFKTSLGQL